MKKILINDNSWQTRIAIVQENELQNLYFSSHAHKTLERIYFKGIVLKVLPGIQTAFVDIGQERAGFLHISEIDRELAISEMTKHLQLDEDDEHTERKVRKQIDIAKILHEGEQVLVQVSKEPVYEKGAKLTTCFTLPGRFVVLMPNIPRMGVSKKIAEKDERIRLKTIVRNNLPEGMGAIIRTTAENRNEEEILKDLRYLIDTYRTIEKAYAVAQPKDKVHEDIPLPLQIIRDHLDNDVEEIITDTKDSERMLYQFVQMIAPERANIIKLYTGDTPLFDRFGLEQQIEKALEKKVELRSGGSLIIESTEAMTVVDVNTGKFTGKGNMEETIFKTNMEASQEIVRQLKLRNIGGLIVIDFIDMSLAANRQKLFRHFERLLREQDKFQSVVLKLSEFGLVQMTRKRSGKTLVQQLTNVCKDCHGSGFIKSIQTECYALLRILQEKLRMYKDAPIMVHLNPHIFEYMTNTEYNAILDLEKQHKCKITLSTDPTIPYNQYKIEKK
jgi:ribonuclease G